ncbi:MAG: hypothetical protein FJX46_16565 [Alphaproteobacteria bacterium]|nr:hypothetical protein [Alphaproteobacteria bacterium]
MSDRDEDSAAIDRGLASLHAMLHGLWRFGANALVGWTATPRAIEVITVPKIRLFATVDPHRRIFNGERRMGANTFREVSTSLGSEPIEIRLERPVGSEAGEIDPERIEQAFLPFAITETEHRALFLIDIVGFSRGRPEQQASQLATLEFALNIVQATAEANGMVCDLARSTTGDGFYVWNRFKGLSADVDLLAAMVLFLAFHKALARTVQVASAVPRIRVVTAIGRHYTYFQPRAEPGETPQYIVGQVSIEAARLIGSARDGQIMAADDHRPDDTGIMLDIHAMLARAAQRLAGLSDVTVMGQRIAKVELAATGPAGPDGRIRPQKLRVVDKHGFEHFGYNVTARVDLAAGEPLISGLTHAELIAPKVKA